MEPNRFPAFFAAAPRIRVADPLAGFLGAAADGILEYGYADAVKGAGHSCPTVASAFLMTRAALQALYPAALPQRGGIRVDLREARDAGVAGVVAAVAALVTGAAGDTGFRGIGGHFNRRDTLFFGQPLTAGTIRFTRLDSRAAVEVAAHLDRVPGDGRIGGLLPRCLDRTASPEETALFRELWQSRVQRLLLDHADDPAVIATHAVP
jgi:hypothetical protein